MRIFNKDKVESVDTTDLDVSKAEMSIECILDSLMQGDQGLNKAQSVNLVNSLLKVDGSKFEYDYELCVLVKKFY